MELGESRPVPAEPAGELAELLSWLFGDADHAPVIRDSRQITQLARVVESPDGRSTPRETRDLQAADSARGGPLQELLGHLQSALTHLRQADQAIDAFAEDERAQQLARECAETAQRLLDRDARG